MFKVTNNTARLMTLNVMVNGIARSVEFYPNKQTPVKDKATARTLQNDAYFKANVAEKNLSIGASNSALDTDQSSTTAYVYTDAIDFLKGNIAEVTARVSALTVEQLQEAITAEEGKGEDDTRKTLLKVLIKAAETLID